MKVSRRLVKPPAEILAGGGRNILASRSRDLGSQFKVSRYPKL